MNQKNYFKLCKYLAGPLILIVLFWKVGFLNITTVLTSTRPSYFIIAYLLFMISVFIAAVNVYLILTPFKKIAPRTFLNYFFASRVTSLVLPGRLGEFSITYFLRREGINLGQGLAAVLIDKLTTLFCSAIIGLIALYTIFGGQHIVTLLFYFLAAIILFCFLLSKKVRALIKKWILRQYAHNFTGFSATLFSYAKEHYYLIVLNIFITAVRLVVIAFSAYYMFLAVGAKIGLMTLILVGGLETLSTFIPLAINGLGIKQALGIYIFTQVGIAPQLTAARYVLGILIQYTFGFLSTIFIKTPPESRVSQTNENTH